jgi:putative membrane protein
MKYLLWLLKAAIFFTLFAFALNNQHDATVYFFFGTHWRAPLVLVVLAAFAGGLVVGALGMLPGWWKHRAAAAAQGTLGDRSPPHNGTDGRARSRSGTVHLRHRPPRRTSTWTLIPAGC